MHKSHENTYNEIFSQIFKKEVLACGVIISKELRHAAFNLLDNTARLPNAFRHAAVHNNNGEKNEDAELTGTVWLLKFIPNKAELSYLQGERERLLVFKRKILKMSSIIKKAGENISQVLFS